MHELIVLRVLAAALLLSSTVAAADDRVVGSEAPAFSLPGSDGRTHTLAEHAGMTRSDDRRFTTHHVRQSRTAQLLLVPCNIGYHLAHHVDSGIPFRNLPKLQAALEEDGYLPATAVWPSYWSLWKALVRT